MQKRATQITAFFSLVFFSFQGISKLPVSGRVLLTLKGEELKSNLGNDVVLDASELGIKDLKATKNTSARLPLKDLIQSYHPTDFLEVQIFSKEISKNTPYFESPLSPSEELSLRLTRKELQKSAPILFWKTEKSMLDLEFSHGKKKHHIESIYKIHIIEKRQEKTNVKIDKDF